MHTFFQDLRYALRQLRTSPGFTAVAAITLGIGIGVNAALFAILDGMLLRPLPVRDPQQLISFSFEQKGGWSNGFSYPAFQEIQKQTTDSLTGVAGFFLNRGGIVVNGKAERSLENYVTCNFFPATEIAPALGRLIAPADCGGEGSSVAVLGYSFWKSHLGGDRSIIGSQASINGHRVTIIGVAQKGFHGMIGMLNTDAYLPLGMATVDGSAAPDSFTNPSADDLMLFGWAKPGVGIDGLQPQMDLVGSRLTRQFPTVYKDIRLHATRLGPMGPSSGGAEEIFPVVAVFITLTLLILILACVNVTNLILVRASSRQREVAVRFALGAGRFRIIRQLLTETLVLGLLGYVVGIILGAVALHALPFLSLGTDLPIAMDFPFDWRVYTLAMLMAIATGLLAGIFPAMRMPKMHLNEELQEGARSVSRHGQRLRSLLSVAQVAGSLVLLITAGLFVRSFQNVRGVDLGFESAHVLNLSIDPHNIGLNEAQGRDLLNRILSRVRSLPGVRSAAVAATVPMGYIAYSEDVSTPGGPVHRDAGRNSVSPGYFETLQIPLLRGRGIQDTDTSGSPPVAVINQAMADELWPGRDPIGSTFKMGASSTPIQVVGIVKNSRIRHITTPPDPYFYLPIAQNYLSDVTLQVRTAGAPDAMSSAIVQAIQSIAPELPVTNIQTMSQAIATLNGSMSFEVGATLAAALGMLGLLLAVIGLYGVIAYAASRRTAEIGLRIALGAGKRDVLFLVLKQGIVIVAVGLAIGCVGAALMARLMNSMLYGVSATDPVIYAGVCCVLSTVAILACLVPARRAAAIDPMQALRTN
jgi:predicted permease